MGYMYDEEGIEVKNDYNKAIELGRIKALCNLGLMYECSKGVKQDYHKAKELYAKAAVKKNTSSMDDLGSIYEYGNGVLKDLEKAKAWYKKIR